MPKNLTELWFDSSIFKLSVVNVIVSYQDRKKLGLSTTTKISYLKIVIQSDDVLFSHKNLIFKFMLELQNYSHQLIKPGSNKRNSNLMYKLITLNITSP